MPYLTGLTQRDLYGQSYRLKEDITVADPTARTRHVVGPREVDVVAGQRGVRRAHRHGFDRLGD
ncbi:hypothetical protein A8713_29710 [Streptomyces sp. SAT1]|nr:hypothetical protein A8713_29710 [Streptomyces sp. SAT1]